MLSDGFNRQALCCHMDGDIYTLPLFHAFGSCETDTRRLLIVPYYVKLEPILHLQVVCDSDNYQLPVDLLA